MTGATTAAVPQSAAARCAGDLALYRTDVHSRPHQAVLTVFFELPWNEVVDVPPEQRLAALLGLLWRVPVRELRIGVARREQQLLAAAAGSAATGDLRLFETGFWHGPIYAEPAQTLLLVCPATLARLVAVQAELPIVDATHSMPAPL